jgi:DNA-binding transcriptional LysR family regulator
MTIDQLRSFSVVAKLHSIRNACPVLHISQPAISKQLKTLERNLGVKLYVRRGAGVELTDDGRSVLSKIELILKQIEELEASFRGKNGHENKSINFPIAAVFSVAANVLPSVIARFEESHPGVKVVLHTGNSRQIQQMIQKGQVELGVSTYRSLSADVDCEPFRIQSLVFFVNRVHPLAERRGMTLPDLLAYPLVTRSSLSGPTWSHDILKQFCDQGLQYKLALQCNVPMEVKRAVANNIGVGLTYLDNLKEEVAKGQFVVLKGADFKFTTLSYIAFSNKRPLSPVAQEFLALLREFKRIPDRESLNTKPSRIKPQPLKLVAKICQLAWLVPPIAAAALNLLT